MDGDLPNVALSIRQPWAFSIVRGGKNIENRSWPTRFRGPFLIHASKGLTNEEVEDWRDFINDQGLGGSWLDGMYVRDLERGGIVGVGEVVDCVSVSASPWFMGTYGFVLANVKPLPFMAVRGALGFFRPVLLGAADGASCASTPGAEDDVRSPGLDPNAPFELTP